MRALAALCCSHASMVLFLGFATSSPVFLSTVTGRNTSYSLNWRRDLPLILSSFGGFWSGLSGNSTVSGKSPLTKPKFFGIIVLYMRGILPFRGSVGALPLFLFWYYHYITLRWKSQGEIVNNSSGFTGALPAPFRGVFPRGGRLLRSLWLRWLRRTSRRFCVRDRPCEGEQS